jgi:outer membrane protein OmpA-like peptidoglycan-associated protein
MSRRIAAGLRAPQRLAWLGGLAAVLACASTDPLVTEMRARYEGAARDPEVQRHASVELYEAEQSLERLERADRLDRDEAEIRHLAHLTQDRIDIARLGAERGRLQETAEQLTERRDELRLAARSRDAQIAQTRADRAEAAALYAQQRAVSAEERAAELEQELTELEAEQTERGLVVTLRDVLFAFNRAELQPGAHQDLDRIARHLEEHPDLTITVEGHTDSVGDTGYNQELSEQRAQAVADYLFAEGVDRSRVSVRGLGESQPVAPNTNLAGRQQNRRVEIVFPR